MSSGMWHRTLIYLGLREEPEEDYDGVPEHFVPEDDPHAEHAAPRPRGRQHDDRAGQARGAAGDVRLADSGRVRAVPEREEDSYVRAVPSISVARAAVVNLNGFDDVPAVGSRYRTGQAVLFDCAGASAADARRVVDFVSGLTYALHGSLTKVGTRAFLLVPDGVQLPADERRRLADLGYRVGDRSEG